ncbi:hypothetical protein [Mycobacterium asiaticum]|uniref:Uncharacterized protein n=1 Tax=Mycobacterium asiaticum TaxID=1790 RepID=A0A1A3KM22_MYCAS|nr:hypothetical protein [Mycobacterium asiaticum]OBJ86075.1 hypothetical protein A5640_11235 [Mycobacterium asiaticum]
MGQYFTPTFLNTTNQIIAALDPCEYGSGLKLAGHTRAHTPLMSAVQALLALDGGMRLVWAGDCADPDGHDANVYFGVQERHFVRFAGLVEPDVEANAPAPQSNPGALGYVCNLDKHVYIDNRALPLDDYGWQRTPLPLLTADAGEPPSSPATFGSWARGRIVCSNRCPDASWTALAPR